MYALPSSLNNLLLDEDETNQPAISSSPKIKRTTEQYNFAKLSLNEPQTGWDRMRESDTAYLAGHQYHANHNAHLASRIKALSEGPEEAENAKADNGIEAIEQRSASSVVTETALKALNLLIPAAHAGESRSMCHRPTYSQAKEKYSEVEYIDDLSEKAGGKLKQNFDSGVFFNGCASRISFVLGQTNCRIPVIPGQTVSGAKGEQYIYRVSALVPFLNKAYGPPDCEWRDGVLTKSSNPQVCHARNLKGIVVESLGFVTPTATGHAFVGSPTLGLDAPAKIKLWKLVSDDSDDKVELSPFSELEEW